MHTQCTHSPGILFSGKNELLNYSNKNVLKENIIGQKYKFIFLI